MEGYKPSQGTSEEIAAAEKVMSSEEKKLSKFREEKIREIEKLEKEIKEGGELKRKRIEKYKNEARHLIGENVEIAFKYGNYRDDVYTREVKIVNVSDSAITVTGPEIQGQLEIPLQDLWDIEKLEGDIVNK